MSLLYDEGQLAIATESRRILEARMSDASLLALLDRQGAWYTPFNLPGMPGYYDLRQWHGTGAMAKAAR